MTLVYVYGSGECEQLGKFVFNLPSIEPLASSVMQYVD